MDPQKKKKNQPIFAADVLGQREERLLSQGLLRRQRCRLLFEEDEQCSALESPSAGRQKLSDEFNLPS